MVTMPFVHDANGRPMKPKTFDCSFRWLNSAELTSIGQRTLEQRARTALHLSTFLGSNGRKSSRFCLVLVAIASIWQILKRCHSSMLP